MDQQQTPSTPQGRSKFAESQPLALVTGASAGLGREIVRQLVLEKGMNVLATARSLERLQQLQAELPEGRVQILAGDLTDPSFRDVL